MRNNFLFVAALIASLLTIVGCKPKNEVSVEEVANSMVGKSFEGTVTRSLTTVDGLTMSIVEYTITDAAAQEITVNSFAYGNKVQNEAAPFKYVYAKQGLGENGLGFKYQFTGQDGVVKDVLYWGNAFVVDGVTYGDAKAPIANLKKVDTNFPNHKWILSDTVFQVLYDTITYMDTTYQKVRRPGPDGKPVVVVDTIIEKKTKILADTIGPKTVQNARYNFTRNAQFENAGHRYEKHEWFKLNADSTAMIPERADSLIEYDFHWGIMTLTSATRFRLMTTVDGKDEKVELGVANLNLDKGVVDLASKSYKLND